MPSLAIELAIESDLEALVALEDQRDTSEFIVPYSLSEHVDCFSELSSIYLRIMNAERMIGFFILSLGDDGCNVEFRRIVVDVKERGVGQDAIRLMEIFCTESLGRKRIWLDVFETNARARHVYEKMGYVRFDSGTFNSRTLIYYEKSLA